VRGVGWLVAVGMAVAVESEVMMMEGGCLPTMRSLRSLPRSKGQSGSTVGAYAVLEGDSLRRIGASAVR